MVRKYALIEKCALTRERFMAPPTFQPYLYAIVISTATDPLWLSTSFEDTVSGKKLKIQDSRNTVSLERADSKTSQDPQGCIPPLR